MPTTRAIQEMEDRVTAFDVRAVIARLSAAGARWLHFDAGSYGCYDGSHLVEAEAIRFSRDVARLMAGVERKAGS